MPIKVFNETFGRDEEKVFGENTNRSFGEIEVPSVPEFEELSTHVGQLRRELDESKRLLEVEFKERDALSARSLDREHAEHIVLELKEALADTSVFSNAMLAALDSHEKRLRAATENVHREMVTLHHQAQASAMAAQACLEDYRKESTSTAQKMAIELIELKVMLEATQQIQNEAIVHAAEVVAGLRQFETSSNQLNQGGFWMRLKWLFRGNTSTAGT